MASYSLPHPQACIATGLVRSALNIIRIRIDYKEEKRVRETRELDNNLPRLLLVMSRHCLHGNHPRGIPYMARDVCALWNMCTTAKYNSLRRSKRKRYLHQLCSEKYIQESSTSKRYNYHQ